MNPSTLAALVIRLRWVFIILFSAITVFFAVQLPKAQMDTEMKNQLPRDLPSRVSLDRIEELFGGTDMAMIILSTDDVLARPTLERLQKLTEGMKGLDELQRVISVFTAKDLQIVEGNMVVTPAVPKLPNSEKDRNELKKRLIANPLVYGNLISKDFQDAVLIGFVDPKASDDALIEKLNALTAKVGGPETTYVGGSPATRVSLAQDMRRDMRRFLPIGLLIMLVFLAACFRQVSGVLLPFIVTVMAIIVSMGLIPLLGWKIHTVTILLPVILLAVANNYGIHLLARYQEDNLPGVDITPRELASRGIDALAYPTLACGITTMIGMLALVTHIIIPAKQLGVLSAVGIGFAIAGSLLFIPAVLSVLPRAKPVLGATPQPDHKTSKFFLDRLLAFFAHWVTHRPRAILIGAVVFTAIVGIGATRVVVDTNPMSFYAKSAPIWRSTQLLNEHLGGWAGISVVVEGDIKDPKVLHGIDDLEQHLKKNPLVGTTTSIADVVRKINVVLHDGDPKYDKIPDSRRAIAQYLLLYSMSGNPKDLEKLVDFSYEHAQIMAKITDSGTRAATEVTDYTKAYISEHSNGVHYLVGGLLVLMADMVHHIVWGQIASMAIAGVLVGLLVTVFFRSPVAGLLGVFPLTLALTMIFGVMGFGGIELNMVTALLSSIMIGVGIDYTIHFMWRYRDERRAGLGAEAAIERTLTTTGRGIIFNAFSVVVGFVVLVISAFFPVRFFGLLVAISILGSLVGALVVLPAIVMVVRPKVLEPKPPKPAVQE